MVTPKFRPGDRVTMTNDSGVVFPGKAILSIDESEWAKERAERDGQARYYITPTDTPWFSFPESWLTAS